MNRLLQLFLLLLPLGLSAQQTSYNLDDGYVAKGYDVVAYFNGQPKKGSDKFTAEFDGAKFRFSNQQNLGAFKADPGKYTPKYGGWCAYAMGTSGEKVGIDPETFEVRDGRLYLFYNAFFTNTFEKWEKDGTEKLRAKADENWGRVKLKN